MISKGTIKNWKSYLIISGCVQFIVLTTTSMFFYKGGTYIDDSTSNYIFWYNYFSDLGRTVAHSGVSNATSFNLFFIALSLWGITQIPFYVSFSTLFKNSKGFNRLSIAGSVLGIVNSVSYVGIALTPSDILGTLHNILVVIAFSSIFISSIAYSLVIFKEKNYPNFFALIFALTAFIIGVYFVFIFLAQSSTSQVSLFIYAFGQKFMIYSLLICGIIQGYGALKHLAF